MDDACLGKQSIGERTAPSAREGRGEPVARLSYTSLSAFHRMVLISQLFPETTTSVTLWLGDFILLLCVETAKRLSRGKKLRRLSGHALSAAHRVSLLFAYGECCEHIHLITTVNVFDRHTVGFVVVYHVCQLVTLARPASQ